MGDLYTKPQAKAGSIGRGLSESLWNQAPKRVLGGNIGDGFGFVDDFLSYDDASYRWLLTAATSGTSIMDPAAKGGVLLLDTGAATINQGPQIQAGGAIAASSFIASASSNIYFETRLKLVTIGSTTLHFFGGLSEVLATTLASAANTSTNHVGFEAINTTTLSYVHEKAGTRVSDTSAGTIADGTYIKLGFLIKGLTSITPFVDGIAGTEQTASIPIVAMTPTIAVHSAATTRPVAHVDWVACIQEEDIAN